MWSRSMKLGDEELKDPVEELLISKSDFIVVAKGKVNQEWPNVFHVLPQLYGS